MKIAVFCASSTPNNNRYAKAAEELGKAIARGGHQLYYGGSNLGLMGVLSGAVMKEGGYVVAVIPSLFSESIIKSQTVSELRIVGSMAERKEQMIAEADVFIALPGGIGTIDEVAEVMVANQLKQVDKPIILVNIDGFYTHFIAQLEMMQREGLMRAERHTGLMVVDSVEAAIESINKRN